MRWRLSRKDPGTAEKGLYLRIDRGGELMMGKKLEVNLGKDMD